MMQNRHQVRSDITYISRRIKPAPLMSSAAPGQATDGTRPPLDLGRPSRPDEVKPGQSLDLSRPGRTADTPASPESTYQSGPPTAPTPVRDRPSTPEDRLFPAPGIEEVNQLNFENPVVRLNARQSAIGTLTVSGARAVTWEASDLTTGASTYHGHTAGTPVVTAGNRPLAGFHDAAAVVSLRHVRLLRRALFIGAGGPITVRLFDGHGIAASSPNEEDRTVLLLTRIGGLLELRAEFVPAAEPDPAIWERHGITMTIPVAAPNH